MINSIESSYIAKSNPSEIRGPVCRIEAIFKKKIYLMAKTNVSFLFFSYLNNNIFLARFFPRYFPKCTSPNVPHNFRG
jgi:hypothetical protein